MQLLLRVFRELVRVDPGRQDFLETLLLLLRGLLLRRRRRSTRRAQGGRGMGRIGRVADRELIGPGRADARVVAAQVAEQARGVRAEVDPGLAVSQDPGALGEVLWVPRGGEVSGASLNVRHLGP